MSIEPLILQTSTDTPTPTATNTITATASSTGTPTFNPGALYQPATLESGQTVALVYTFTAGEAAISSIDLLIVVLLMFIVFLMLARGRNG